MGKQDNEVRMTRNTVMIVDDEVLILKSLERELEAFAEANEIEVLTFDSPRIALEETKAGRRDIAVIIADQKMPQMKGFDFLGQVRERNPDIVFIVLTAYADIDDMVETIRTGLFSYVLKPWNIGKLTQEIRKALEVYRLRQENRRNAERLNDALMWGGEIQRKLLSRPMPDNERIKVHVNYTPMAQYACGGDYYDIITIDGSRYLAVMGDVSGHGVKAAFITFILKTLLNEAVGSWRKGPKELVPSKLMEWLNARLFRELRYSDSILVTICSCLIDLETQTLTTANAGHLPPKLLRGKKILSVPVSGTAMGFQPDIGYEDKRIAIEPGDKIVLYTDGLADGMHPDRSLESVMLRNRDRKDFCDIVVKDAVTHSGEGFYADDVAVMSIDIKG